MTATTTTKITAYGCRMSRTQKNALETIKNLRDASKADMAKRIEELKAMDPTDPVWQKARPSEFITVYDAMRAGVRSDTIDALVRLGLVVENAGHDGPREIRPTV